MNEEKLNGQECFYQCTQCGALHAVDINKVFSLKDDIYYETYCSECGRYTKHLWCGEIKEDIEIWYNPIFDNRYY